MNCFNSNGVTLLCFVHIEIINSTAVLLLFCKTLYVIVSDFKVLIAYYIFSLMAVYLWTGSQVP